MVKKSRIYYPWPDFLQDCEPPPRVPLRIHDRTLLSGSSGRGEGKVRFINYTFFRC